MDLAQNWIGVKDEYIFLISLIDLRNRLMRWADILIYLLISVLLINININLPSPLNLTYTKYDTSLDTAEKL